MEVYLAFHGLGEPGATIPDDERPYWIGVERYRAILDAVVRRATAGAAPGGADAVGITFDDGNRSDVEIGLPHLVERGLHASFFIVSERIGEPGYLAADDIRALDRAGMTVGSHGARHVRWTGLDDGELRRQVTASLAVLSDILGRRVDRVAVPFGAYDRRVLAVLRRAGVARAYNSDFGPAWPGAWLVARNSVRADTPVETVRGWLERRHGVASHVGARLRQARRSLAAWR